MKIFRMVGTAIGIQMFCTFRLVCFFFFLQFQVTGSLHLGKFIVRNDSVFVLSILEIGSYTASDQLLGASDLN